MQASTLVTPTVNGRRLTDGTHHDLLPLSEYDLCIVSLSGGKDSIASLIALLDRGVDRDKIELWHQCVDGDPGHHNHLMDWPITPAYCRAVARAFGIKFRMQWKHGGFEREMLRASQRTAPTVITSLNGDQKWVGGAGGKEATRRMFPQVSANLRVRWCSSYLKIDVAAKQITSDASFHSGNYLYISGERREESAARAGYRETEPHRTNSLGKRRRVDHWRIVIDWTEQQVWDAIRRHKINPHPCYHLGWGRCSCIACIFGNDDQWASLRELAPDVFERIAAYEECFGKTIHRKLSIRQRADRGTSFLPGGPEGMALRKLAMSTTYTDPVFVEDWKLPLGAFKNHGGPT